MALTEGRSTEDEARVKAAWERQARIETEAVQEAIRRWKEELASMRRAGAVDRHPTALNMMLKWFEPLSEAIAAEQQQAGSLSFKQRVAALHKVPCSVASVCHKRWVRLPQATLHVARPIKRPMADERMMSCR